MMLLGTSYLHVNEYYMTLTSQVQIQPDFDGCRPLNIASLDLDPI